MQYAKESLRRAIAVYHQGTKLSTAARQFGVPRNTLRRHIQKEGLRLGGRTILTEQQEDTLAKRILYLGTRGFPLSLCEFRKVAFLYADTLRRRRQLNGPMPQSWIANKQVSRDWWLQFRKRNPTLVLRKPEGLSAARAQGFNEERVNQFFLDLRKIYDECGVDDFPQLVYNADETGLSSVPSVPNLVIARKGSRAVQTIRSGERGVLTTVIPSVNACGDHTPPFVIIKGASVPTNLRETYARENIAVTATKSGYVDHEAFLLFLKHFNTHRVKIPEKKTILILDGHASHTTVEAIEF